MIQRHEIIKEVRFWLFYSKISAAANLELKKTKILLQLFGFKNFFFLDAVDGGAMATAPVTGCQQVQQPVCTDATICQASAQQCCQVKVEQVCRQVPQRVTEMVCLHYLYCNKQFLEP